MTDSGLTGLRKADNSRIPGWRVVREYLKPDENGSPRLLITRSCKNLIRCLPQLTFDRDVTEDASEFPHEITHAPEALRYALMSREPGYDIRRKKDTFSLYSFGESERNEKEYEDILY